jgi:hypothetical protein
LIKEQHIMASKNVGRGRAVIKWDEEMAKHAAAAAAGETGTGGSWLSLKGGLLAYGGNQLPGNKIEVIVVDAVHENQYFTEKYDPDSPASPACYAFGRKEEGRKLEMAPHENAPDKQSEACNGCEFNEWASADKGRGKACKEVRRLALILADGLDTPSAVADAEVVYLKVPVTSVKAWGGYVQQIAALGRPPFAVVTEISLERHPQYQFLVQFKLVEQIKTAPMFTALLAKHEEVAEKIMFPYPERDETEAPRKQRGKKAEKKQKYR